jgi:GAF domain-containing protein
MSDETDLQGAPPRSAAKMDQGELAAALIAASRAMAGVTDRPSLTAAIGESLSRLDIDAYALARYRGAERADLERIGAWDRDGSELPDQGGDAEASFPGVRSLKPGEWRVYDDCQSAPDLDEGARRALLERGIRAAATVPLVQRDEVVGVFSATRREPHEHSHEEIQLLDVIAQLASVKLVNIERRERLAAQVKLARALYQLSEELSQMSDEAELFKATTETLVHQIGYSGGWIGTVNEDRRGLASRASTDTTNVENPLLVYDLSDKSVGAVEAFHAGQPVVIPNLLARARAEGWGEVAAAARIHSAIYVPLKVGGETIGVLGVSSSEETMNDDEVALVAAFGNHVAGAIGRVRTERERQAQLESLQLAYAEQARLLDIVRELSTPVIPVYKGVLVLPLVGAIDASRSAQLMEALLDAIVRDRASVVILDVTGVPVVDNEVVDHLLKAVGAASLLGARCVLAGISPAVAQAMVQLGVDTRGIVACGDLEAAVTYSLRLRGLAIRPLG